MAVGIDLGGLGGETRVVLAFYSTVTGLTTKFIARLDLNSVPYNTLG